MKITVVVTHAAFAEERRATMARLREQLAVEMPDVTLRIARDHEREGSLECWHSAMLAGLGTDATHIVWLPDDAILCKGFGLALARAIAAQPDQIFDCVVNHPGAEKLPPGWYTTHEGYVGGAGVMPRALVEQHLAWRDERIGWAKMGEPGYMGNDYGVNLWAMATGRLIWKTTRSLIDHDTSIPSLDGNDNHAYRRPLFLLADGAELTGLDKPPTHLGRTYLSTHWAPIFETSRWGPWDIDVSYLAERGGKPVSTTPHVFLAMPAYMTPELGVRRSVEATRADLRAHGIESTLFESPGDSLVTRGRHCLCHEFLRSEATHMLQWDADIECLDPSAVRKMLESGHDIVGGAYPWRDGSGRVVVNPLSSTLAKQEIDIDPHNCIPVAEVGTGFLLTSRKVLRHLMDLHPELLYQADLVDYAFVPMWALFDAHLETRPDGRKRYASEDWRFCSLAREAGYGVWIYYPPVFRHWGKWPHGGHVTDAWKMNAAKPVPVLRTAAE